MIFPLKSINPLAPYKTVTQGFGPFHNGIDFDTPNSPPYEKYLAAANGKILKVGWDERGYGFFLDIEHANGFVSRGAHLLERPRFDTGYILKEGQVAGICDNTGHSTGHHLHFELFATLWDYQKRKRTDPISSILNHLTMPIQFPTENYLYQLVEGGGGFGLYAGGKFRVDMTEKLLASFIVRNGGDINGKTATCTLQQWTSVPHYNLKGEPV